MQQLLGLKLELIEDAADAKEATATVEDATTATCRVEARVEDAAAAEEATAMVEDAIITARVEAVHVSKAEEATAGVEDAIPARVEARVKDAAEAKEAPAMVGDATTARVDAKLGKDQRKSESESELNQRRSEFETDIHAKIGKDQQMSGMSALEPKLNGTEMEVIGTHMEVIAKLGKDQQMSVRMSAFEPKLKVVAAI